MPTATRSRRAPVSRRQAKRMRRQARRKRLGMGIAAAGALAVLGTAGVVLLQGGGDEGDGRSTQARAVPSLSESPTVDPAEPIAPEPTAAPGGGGAPQSGAAASPTASGAAGQGTFSTAVAGGDAVGKGTIRRYKVEVEDGLEVDPKTAADQINAILSDKRSWTSDGKNGFQLVASGTYDFTVRIASPDTVDKICRAAGLDTKGEVNCDVGKQVMVNSKRWLTGSPQFQGPIEEYRALIINHEVGHRIGHGHETCPGPGKPAPAMMQQIYGLKGCKENAWPYSADGTYLSGPAVP
ncbi:DUF3152 domain-containing protein [Kitasatospora camelliae]|uniref:DUF3152 domain-containing protein n=1 Tax=Kitasatospora camelliae TaxID=3156397 RepID=A0AAU8JXI1_9ACTN